MLGVGTPGAGGQPTGNPDATDRNAPPPAASQRGFAHSGESAPPAGVARPRLRVSYGEIDGSAEELPGAQRRRKLLVWLFGGMAVGLLLLLATVGGVAGYMWLFDKPSVHARVVQTGRGDALQITVPDAPQGAKVRFDGREKTLRSGAAQFPLSADDLDIGNNEITVEVVDPDGAARSASLTLTVDYRIRAELSSLEEDPPAITIVAEASPKSKVTLDGEPFELGDDGHAERRFPVEATRPEKQRDSFEHAVPYRIELPSGTSSKGYVRTTVPYATLQVERPGDDFVVTEEEVIQLAGRVHGEARVSIDGEAIPVEDGRFDHSYPLPEPGTYRPAIEARRAGRAPRRVEPTFRRVKDLRQAAREFEADTTLTYARIEASPEDYRGQKVDMRGRVYNVQRAGGDRVLQMLVRDCESAGPCALWVTYPVTVSPETDQEVRVLGTIAGEQQFRNPEGDVVTVPKIDARFVLPVR